ncbi:glycosyltransferase [Leptolyngbya sp. NK1-12]|uniref:Glycosyltransferase n=1 Tax=Leptolyngbya sp. NK1-12 TaxID=2547451 RepID=A0AA96WMI6_9CYAN|nr:glycosyltransferase [Leptolyngbya sp. NK1-12]WNZ27455.1 glycosyltransferase [Leptolyngbya sp. NK1-12]
MNILFLDQSGKPGGAELCLLDIATPYRECCLVGLLADGSFRERLEQQQIPVRVLTTQAIRVRKESDWLEGIRSGIQLLPLIGQIAQLCRQFDLIYANTQKAFVLGALASLISRKPLVYHLHDILSPDHFSAVNRQILVTLANRVAALIIANSSATQAAFIKAGGRPERVHVVYNGFDPQPYQQAKQQRSVLRAALGLEERWVIGHFSRLSPWKGQHVLLEALSHCPEQAMVLFVGDALFGEQAYVEQLHQQVQQLGLEQRVQFLGFRADVPELMAACDLVVHSSVAPEPFGRVIVEAMLAGKPVIAAAAGGAMELIEPNQTGWLVPPQDSLQLAAAINQCLQFPEHATTVAHNAKVQASERFHIANIHQQIDLLLRQFVQV